MLATYADGRVPVNASIASLRNFIAITYIRFLCNLLLLKLYFNHLMNVVLEINQSNTGQTVSHQQPISQSVSHLISQSIIQLVSQNNQSASQ